MRNDELIIFDWDGTLAKTLHLWLIGYREGLQKQGHTFLDQVIAKDFFYEHDEAALKYPNIDLEELVTYAREFVQQHITQLELYTGVEFVLDSLSHKKMALVSSSPRRLLEAGLEEHKLTKYFELVVAGDDVSKHKPHPEAFLQVIKYFDVSPEKTLIIGDAKTDILAGKAAGTKTCLFSPADNGMFYDFEASRTAEPDCEVQNLIDFLSI
jgi:pyrophosphatase PpaX